MLGRANGEEELLSLPRNGQDSADQSGVPAIGSKAGTAAQKTGRFMAYPSGSETGGHEVEYTTGPEPEVASGQERENGVYDPI